MPSFHARSFRACKLAAFGKFAPLGEKLLIRYGDLELAKGSSVNTMASPKNSNYLIKHRKRLGLTQDEVAFLLGTRGGSKVSRYERFARAPNLETALAFEALYQRPASELFAGLYKEIEKRLAERAKVMSFKAEFRKPGPSRKTVHRLQVLQGIASRQTNNVTRP